MRKNINKKQHRTFSSIGYYNQEVRAFLDINQIPIMVQHAIKIFKDNAQLKGYSEFQYNIEVEKFNKKHGFWLYKKGEEFEKTTTNNAYYSYINYPFIDSDAFRETMDNYRAFAEKYNAAAKLENAEIKKYNHQQVKQLSDLSENDLNLKSRFEDKNKSLFVREYNVLAEEFNTRTPIIPKKRIQQISLQAEVIFSVFLGYYVKELRLRNAYLMNLNRPTSVSKSKLPRLEINQKNVSNHKIKGVRRLKACRRTIQNHVRRFRESGILIDYKMVNRHKPISVRFNPEILVILDGNPPKSQISKNQSDSSDKKQRLHVICESTKQFSKENKKKDFAESKELKQPSDAAIVGNFYKSTKGAELENSPGGGRGKISLKFQNSTNSIEIMTDNFLSKADDDSELAERLAAGTYDRYSGLRYDYLLKISQYALVSSEEFKQVLIQDVIKISAKIWKEHTVYAGEWKKAINQLNELLFKDITRKETMISKLREYRWKLNFARKWFLKSKINALYPSMYFDVTRKKSAEIGFYGLNNAWKSHLRYQEKRKQDKFKQQQNSNTRKRVIKAKQQEVNRKMSIQRKYLKIIGDYHLGKKNYNQVRAYVKHNLPEEYSTLLASAIQNNLA